MQLIFGLIMSTSHLSPVPNDTDMAPPPADFYLPGQYAPDRSVGYLMRRVMHSVLQQADRELAAHDLTHAQWLPLYKLTMGDGAAVAVLARELETDPGAMTRSLDRLEAKGLIRRERSTADRRVVNVQLTDEGRAVAQLVPPVLARVLNTHLSGFSRDEWELMLNLLHRMVANGDRMREAGRQAGTPSSDA